MSNKIDCRGGRVRSVEVERRDDQTERSFPTPICKRPFSIWSERSSSIASFVDERPSGAAEQLQHPGLHGSEAGRAIDESPAICCSARTAPGFAPNLLLEPRHHQPHLFVLLPANPPGRPAAMPDRLQHQRPLRRLGRPCRRKSTRPSKQELCETTLDALEKYVPNIRERIDHVEASTPVTFRALHPAHRGASFGTKFEGLAVSRGLPQQIDRPLSRGQRRHHHVWLAGGDELRT